LDDSIGGDDAVVRGLGLRGLLERVVDQDAEQARRVAQGSEFDLDGFVIVRREGVEVKFVGERAGFDDRVFVVVFHCVFLLSRLHACANSPQR
jgi:hypothetical protein